MENQYSNPRDLSSQLPFATLHPHLLMALYRALTILNNRNIRGGGYYEFGLYKGFSFWFANNLAHDIGLNLKFYGFDSFEGLPKSNVDIHRNWKEGSYSASIDDVTMSLKKWGMPLPYTLIQGWYSKKLFDTIQSEQPFDKPVIVLIDCDLYESAIEVLNFIHPKMSIGLILLFDDWNAFGGDENHGERRAVREYEHNNPSFKKSSLFSFGTYGEAFQVVNI